ncbi:glutaredoxin domain-containing cysteine-rich protein 2 [Triplophysa rosa]|uniref:Glutaredoxin domain-containing cysteine-rich protein 2 n=1 Tax=Triplophysa rosa TaxID=992332 RepID=A0A9W7WFD4_TRIRA|nr:glutaredoxin domain-containing cysteine-rich protein 2 [Triplophysa rosa]KAI7795678.1 putative glutaredoxin domain-containing cysteine-rich protein 2 [Triplophysa rosa]
MEELQSSTRIEGKPRKVRFKLASSYSGRVLKHVYEDGQELDSPEEQYPNSFINAKMEMGKLCGIDDMQDPPTGLIAQRINVYRGVGGCPLTCGDLPEGDNKAPVLDFGKIIIYTSNLKIVRAPHRKRESGRSPHRSRDRKESSPRRTSRSKERNRTACSHAEEPDETTAQKKEAGSCGQCGGSGSSPCSLCHGSKLSMLANRFNESIRELRCPACNPHGLERCQSCAH